LNIEDPLTMDIIAKKKIEEKIIKKVFILKNFICFQYTSKMLKNKNRIGPFAANRSINIKAKNNKIICLFFFISNKIKIIVPKKYDIDI
jgi:hypothetical protein